MLSARPLPLPPRAQVVAISAAKFHSVAITADGRLLTWGWGRGGRLGEPGWLSGGPRLAGSC